MVLYEKRDFSGEFSGPENGAATEVERMLGRELLWLSCRHHIYELELKVVFHEIMGASKAPEVQLFKRFQGNWSLINQASYSTVLDCPESLSIFNEETRESIIKFAQTYINVRNTLKMFF